MRRSPRETAMPTSAMASSPLVEFHWASEKMAVASPRRQVASMLTPSRGMEVSGDEGK